MLTGNISITSGEIHLLGKPIHNQISVGYKAIAYCPQIECNFENLTVNDILTYYARLIGFDEQEVNKVTKKMVELVDLSKYHHINSDTLSGGNKRKLSLAIALLGGRSLTYLDEPTTGVDPVARRKIWQTLNLFKKNGNKSFILTSHSMDECEYLCNRIAIMGKGQLLCLGSYSQLRDQYAQGYKLHIRLNFERITDNEYTSQVQQAVLSRIANSELKEFHLNSMVYFIRQGKGVLSQLFFLTNQLQNEFSFENYTISEATLEEVFLSFAIKRSNPNENDPRNPAKETALSPISNV